MAGYSSKKEQDNKTDQRSQGEFIPHIWDENPSYKDIENRLSVTKCVFLIIIIVFMILGTYALSTKLVLSIGIGMSTLILFMIIFRDQFFSFSYLFSFMFRKIVSFDPFKSFYFWYDSNDPTSLFYSNKNDLSHTGIKIFRINVIPDNVHESLNHFIKALSHKDLMINFTYQIVHHPNFTLRAGKSQHFGKDAPNSFMTSIYFCIYEVIRGMLGKDKYFDLLYNLNKYSKVVKGTLVSDFHHFNITLLSGGELINAMRIFFLNGIDYTSLEENDFTSKRKDAFNNVLKLFFLMSLVSYLDFLLFSFKLHVFYVTILSLLTIGIFIWLMWKSLFFRIFRKEGLKCVNPFRDVKFYYYRKVPYSIFLHINNILLVNFKLFNLKRAMPPFFSYVDKFVRAILYHKIPFSYTLLNSPMTFDEFYKEGFEFLNEKAKYGISKSTNEVQWLAKRSGLWRTILNLSLFNHKIIEKLHENDFLELEEGLMLNVEAFYNLFVSNFQNFEPVLLKKRKLISGLLCGLLKNKAFRLNGTHLNYLIFQGKVLKKLAEIANEYKKGVKTRIGAEFNTPLYLDNFITFGHTLDTEVLEKEMPVGFTHEQLKNVLIVNGTSRNRETLSMKIISEGIKAGIPFLIFDFHGNWSRLINQFKDTDNENDILYFKLGRTFTLNPRYSDLAFDDNNLEYLNYMLDAFAMAFKKDDKEIDMFRNKILQEPKLSLGDINLELTSKSNFKRSYSDELLISLFSSFTQDYEVFSHEPGENFKGKIYPYNFIETDKTVIVDLSISRDIKTQVFFVFLMISKIIHYMHYSEDYKAKEKIIVIPYIDSLFDQRHLYYKANYGKVNKFLDPLINQNYGLIFSSNQVFDLHSSVFKFFDNIITFKATDNRDIATLSNLMNLQELIGKGVYSSYRKQTYQISFLKTMTEDEVVIKRSDVHQPFSAIVDVDGIKNIRPLTRDEIIKHMKKQGYDLTDAMRKILQQVRKTIFEKDLGNYVFYLDEIIKFLCAVKTLDNIGNLYKSNLKEELLKYIAPKAKKKGIGKENILKLRNSIFESLIKQGYLIEDHSKRAGGSESLRTSFSVSPLYQKALKDYLETKGRSQTDVSVELLEKDAGIPFNFSNIFRPKSKIIGPEHDLKEAFDKEFSKFNFNIFKIYNNIHRGRIKDAIKIEHDLIKNFIINVHKKYYNVSDIAAPDDLDKFITHLSEDGEFPFTREQLKQYIKSHDVLNLNDEELESRAKQIYNHIYSFFKIIQNYIYSEKNGAGK